MKPVVFVLLLLGVGACASYNDKPRIGYKKQSDSVLNGDTIHLNLDFQSGVTFLGYVSPEIRELGAPNNAAYPGNNGGAFLASVFLHAAIAESAQASREKALQEKASQVLKPYRPFLEGVTNADVVERALPALGEGRYGFKMYDAGSTQHGAVLESVPVYFMTQDQNTIILKNAVKMYSSAGESDVIYENLIETHYSIAGETPAEKVWARDGGKHLIDKSIDLFSESIDLAVDDVAGRLAYIDDKNRTLQYLRGQKKVYQRGKRLRQSCDRMLIRTLRGWLKSVPRAVVTETECKSISAAPPR